MKKILIIDDEKTITTALSFGLKKLGHEIVEAENPMDVLTKLTENSFDLLILDYNLTFLSGNDIIKLLQNNNIQIPIVIISEHKAEEISNSTTVKSSSHIYISKDQTIAKIINQIKDILVITNYNHYQGGSYAES